MLNANEYARLAQGNVAYGNTTAGLYRVYRQRVGVVLIFHLKVDRCIIGHWFTIVVKHWPNPDAQRVAHVQVELRSISPWRG